MNSTLEVSYDELKGELIPPPSKSFSQRYILLASFLPGKKIIGPVGPSDDEKISVGIARSCGMNIEWNGEYITIEGDFHCPVELNCGESGTAFRIVLGMLSSKKCRTSVNVSGRLALRPIKSLLDSLSSHGYSAERTGNTFIVDTNSFRYDGCFKVNPGESSQFVSAILMGLALQKVEGYVELEGIPTSEGYIRITSEVLKNLGVKTQFNGNRIAVSGGGIPMNGSFMVERDFSSAAILITLGLLCSDEGIRIRGLPDTGFQPDSDVLEILKDALEIEKKGDKTDILCRKTDNIPYFEVDVDKTPDLAPSLSIIGMFSKNGMGIRHPQRLNLKESRRLDAILDISRQLNSIVEVSGDLVTIKRGSLPNTFAPMDFRDHRMSMAQFVVCAALMKRFTFPYTGDIHKSFPGFLQEVEKCGFRIKPLL